MVAVGYAVMPVIPSFDGISKEINKQISGPLSKASKDAGDSLEKGMGAAIDKAGERAEKAQYRAKKATDELAQAQSKLEAATLNQGAAQSKVEAATIKVEQAQRKHQESVNAALDAYEQLRKSGTASADELAAAERRITDAREKGQADVASREGALESARGRLVSATQAVTDAQNKLNDAELEHVTAAGKAEQAAKDLANEQARSLSMMDRMRDSASQVGSKMVEVADKYKVHATVAVGAIGAMSKNAMDYASEAEQSYGAVESIFAGHADAIVAKSKEAAEAIGLSGREYRELSSTTGAMLKNMGLPMDEVSGKTQDLMELGADLAATFGGPTSEAMEAIGSLLRGEANPIEKYGVSIKKADINARLAAEGLDKLEGEAAKNAETQMLLTMLYEQTADAQGQFARETDTAAHKQQVATAKMNDAREVIGTALLPIMADLMEMMSRVAQVVAEHPKLFVALGAAIGGLAGSVIVVAQLGAAIKGLSEVTKLASGAFKALNLSFSVSPIGLVVTGIAAVAAGLVYFFTQTEKGRELWSRFTEALAAGWQHVQDFLVAGFEVVRGAFAVVGEAISTIWGGLVSAFQSGWAAVKAVFDAFVQAGTWLVQVVGTVVLTPLILAWEAMSWAVQAGWENIIKPTFDAIAAGATWLWETGVQPVLEFIRAGWEALGTGLQWVYDSLILPVWDLFTAGLSTVWEGAQVAFDLIKMGWQALGDGLRWVYDNTIGPVWDAFGAGLTWLHDNVVDPVTGWITDKWSAMGDGLDRVKGFVVDTVFGGIQRGLDTLQGWFQSAVDGISSIWDGIKRVTARPVRFVVETVYNNGIRRAWNAVARFTGLSELEPAPVGDLGAYARGGVLPGYTPGRDVYRFIDPVRGAQIHLGGGEAVMVPEFTRAVGGERAINALNAAARSGALTMQRFADGGVVEGEDGKKRGSRIAGMVGGLWNGIMKVLPSWSGPGLIGQLPGAMLKHMADAAWEAVKNAVASVVEFFTGGDDEEQGYARGGVLPGWSPGKDIHHFNSPTGGRLALSGGESIMVPEWTRDVGGPAAVERMNRAARAGRSSTISAGARAFADGGTFWAPIGERQLDAFIEGAEALDKIQQTLDRNGEIDQAMLDQLEPMRREIAIIADPTTLEGIAARAFGTQVGEITGLLGMSTTSTVIKALIDAEQSLLASREAQASRINDIAKREAELGELYNRLGELEGGVVGPSDKDLDKINDAQLAVDKAYEHVYKSHEEAAEKIGAAEEKLSRAHRDLDEKLAQEEEKRLAEIEKTHEQIAKSEADLVKARKESARNLDMLIYDVFPGLSGYLEDLSVGMQMTMPDLQAQYAAMGMEAFADQLPGLADAFGQLAVLTGPAGISVGTAVQGLKTAITLVKTIGTAIGDFLERIYASRAQMYQSMVQALSIQHEWAKMVDDQAPTVVSLRVAWVEAQVALRDATWKTSLAQADVVRAQLQGVKSIAEAEAKLEAERKRVAKAALLHFDDMSLEYDRYRWMEYQSMEDRLDLYAQVTPEILALEAEVNVAKLNALAAQKQASLDALSASYEQQKAAMALMQTQQNLALQTQQLALMQKEFFGMGQAESLKAMNTMKLRQELAEVQAQIGKNSWRISYALTGAKAADKARAAELRRQIAEREGTANVNVPKTSSMAFFGYTSSAQNAAKNAGYGRAEAAMFKAQEEQALLNIKQQEQALRQQIEQSQLFEQHQKQVAALTAEIESLKTGAASAQYTADYFREENPAVKAANLALARFEADRSRQYGQVARGQRTVVDITVPEQDVYTREQMNAVLSAVQEIPDLEARVRRIETPAKPGANAAMNSMLRY